MAIKDPSFNELCEKGSLIGRLGDEDVYALEGRWYSVDDYTAADGRNYLIVLALDPWEYELVERGLSPRPSIPRDDLSRRAAPPALSARQGIG